MQVLRRALIALVTAAAVVTGCGGGAPSANDPAGTVTSAFAAAESGGLARLTEFACAAQAASVTSMFGASASDFAQLQAAGIDANELLDALKVDFENVQASETSRSGTTATVHVTGTATMTVDEAKMKAVLAKVLEAQGMPADEATLDAAMAMMGGQLSQSQQIDEDVTVVQEGGKWLICS